MAGPTPVSALIHAATMVTAGVYLIVRSDFIFNATPDARLAVALVGAITLIFGAIVGCAKDDIKKALAASTMSQIGYMMLAAGLGPIGYAFAIFHLLTHGFFKAGMFLGAGSVMHGMNDQVNMRRYGALSLVMKITWVTFGLGWLAIIGVPPFSGFWSKDKIIESAFVGEGWQPWVLRRGRAARRRHHRLLHVAPVLHDLPRREALGRRRAPARVAADHDRADDGARRGLGLPRPDPRPDRHHHDLARAGRRRARRGAPGAARSWLIMVLTLVLVVAGAVYAWRRYGADVVPEVAPKGSALTRAARRDLYQDAVNEGLFMRPGIHLTRGLVFADARGRRRRRRWPGRPRRRASPRGCAASRPATPGRTP